MLFREFVDRKQRDALKHLKLVEKMFRRSDMQVKAFLETEMPYIFVEAPKKLGLSFEGVRIYEVGGLLAYRVQNESETEPYGKAYSLNLEEMFNDFMSEGMKEEIAGTMVIENAVREIAKFFQKSREAEEKLAELELDDPGQKMITVRPNATVYSSAVTGY